MQKRKLNKENFLTKIFWSMPDDEEDDEDEAENNTKYTENKNQNQ
jgi:hypothetical protein